MKEELLHFVWQNKLLLGRKLFTTTGQEITILKPGLYNRDAGPDFFNSRLTIGTTTWAGNVEMHLRSSDWHAHHHDHDPAYDNVILHVVYHHDRSICYSNGNEIPTLELKEVLPPALVNKYEALLENRHHIPCEKIFRLPDEARLSLFLQKLLVQRLQAKCGYLDGLLARTGNHWEQSFYVLTARSFGMKTNAQPFEWLAERLPLQVLARHKHHIGQVRALVFGVSGLISDKVNPDLAQEAAFLLKKYGLVPLPAHTWKSSQTRPANFPAVRLEQFAHFIHHSSHLLSKVLECTSLEQLEQVYSVRPEDAQVLSRDAIRLLLVNTVLPVMFHYGKCNNNEKLSALALDLFEQIPAETNAITRFWKQLGIPSRSMADSQALITLKTTDCDRTDCLNCAIGQNILTHD